MRDNKQLERAHSAPKLTKPAYPELLIIEVKHPKRRQDMSIVAHRKRTYGNA